MKIAIVIFTTNEPTLAIHKYSNIDECDLIIVANNKTPIDKYKNVNCILLSIEKQSKLFPKFHKLLPIDHYCRKNMGYAYAIKNEYDIIVDTNDDIVPNNSLKNILKKKYSKYLISGSDFINVYHMFTSIKMWPRGFPLDKIKKKPTYKILHTTNGEIGIIQGLIDGSPDTDSIFKMVFDIFDNFKFKNNNNMYILDNNSYCSCNGYNTYWLNKDLFYLLYIPCNISYKFCDILKMYIAQKFARTHDMKITFVSPNVSRNNDNIDNSECFSQEIEMFTNINKLIEILNKDEDYDYNLQKLYNILVNENIIYENIISNHKEHKILKEWLKLINGKVYEELFELEENYNVDTEQNNTEKEYVINKPKKHKHHTHKHNKHDNHINKHRHHIIEEKQNVHNKSTTESTAESNNEFMSCI